MNKKKNFFNQRGSAMVVRVVRVQKSKSDDRVRFFIRLVRLDYRPKVRFKDDTVAIDETKLDFNLQQQHYRNAIMFCASIAKSALFLFLTLLAVIIRISKGLQVQNTRR